jgi:hypothetical protein
MQIAAASEFVSPYPPPPQHHVSLTLIIRCEIDLTELDGDDDSLEAIMTAATEDLPPSCRCDGFDFIVSTDRKRPTHKSDLPIKCVGFLNDQCALEKLKQLPCRAGTFCLFRDTGRDYWLLRVNPKRGKIGTKVDHRWYAVDDSDAMHLGEAVDFKKSLDDGARRAAAKVWRDCTCSSAYNNARCSWGSSNHGPSHCRS